MKKIFHLIFKILFSLSLIGLGMKTLNDTNKITPYVDQSIDHFQHKILKKSFDITNLKQHSLLLVLVESYFLIAAGLFTLLGQKFAYFLAFLAITFDLTLVHNVYFYRDIKHAVLACGFLGIFGGVISA